MGLFTGITNALFGKPYQAQQYNVDKTAYVDPNAAATMAQLQAGLTGAGQVGVNQYAPQQQALINALQGQATGQEPSIAQQALRQETDRNIQQQMGALAGNRSIGAGLAARMAGQQGAQLQQQAVGQGALAQAQEKQLAQQNLANALGQARRGDIAGEQLRAQQQQYYQNALLQKAEADRAAKMGLQSIGMQNLQQQQAINAQSQSGQQQLAGNLMAGLGSAAMTIWGPRAKK